MEKSPDRVATCALSVFNPCHKRSTTLCDAKIFLDLRRNSLRDNRLRREFGQRREILGLRPTSAVRFRVFRFFRGQAISVRRVPTKSIPRMSLTTKNHGFLGHGRQPTDDSQLTTKSAKDTKNGPRRKQFATDETRKNTDQARRACHRASVQSVFCPCLIRG